jgi:hypothetical protein
MKGRVDRETKVHRAVAKVRGSRNRAAHHPDYQIPLIVPLWLITAEDVWKLSAEAAKQNPALQVRQATDVERIRVAQHLHHAFDWAVQCDKMQEWEGEPQRKRRWYVQVARQADGLLKALAQSPEECKNPAKEWRWKSRPVAIDECASYWIEWSVLAPICPIDSTHLRGLHGMSAVQRLREAALMRRDVANTAHVRRS